MELLEYIKRKLEDANSNKRVYSLLALIIVILAIFLVAGMLFPTAVAVILNIVWITLITIVIVFISLGILVVFGMRKEVSRILDILVEGSLSVIDFIHFIKEVWNRFLALLRDFLLFISSILAYIVGLLLYVLVIVLYKSVGRSYDVTVVTMILTFVMVYGFGIISKPKVDGEIVNTSWTSQFKARFRAGLIDSFEVVLFVFFLTMDSVNLFFLPAELNIPLQAQLGDYDFMVRGFMFNDHFKTTLNIIVATISLEIFRQALRIVYWSRTHYKQLILETHEQGKGTFLLLVKKAIKQSFSDAKDDVMRFITYTTVLLMVFLLFPRLKLLTLVVASISNLVLDLSLRGRLVRKKNTDLISRLLTFVFRI